MADARRTFTRHDPHQEYAMPEHHPPTVGEQGRQRSCRASGPCPCRCRSESCQRDGREQGAAGQPRQGEAATLGRPTAVSAAAVVSEHASERSLGHSCGQQASLLPRHRRRTLLLFDAGTLGYTSKSGARLLLLVSRGAHVHNSSGQENAQGASIRYT